jgi:hypothetical protein
MTRTFLVAIELPSAIDLLSIAADIHDDLSDSGHNILSVSPWGQTPVSVNQFDEGSVLPPTPLLGLSL